VRDPTTGLYLVLKAHTAPAVFDPDLQVTSEDAYHLLIPVIDGALPVPTTDGHVLTLVAGTPQWVEPDAGSMLLSGLDDVLISGGLAAHGEALFWDDQTDPENPAWVNRNISLLDVEGFNVEFATYGKVNGGLLVYNENSGQFDMGGMSDIWKNGRWVNVRNTTSQFTDTDADTIAYHNSSNPHTFTVPPDATAPLDGSFIWVFNNGTGLVTIAAGTITLHAKGRLTLNQNEMGVLRKINATTWTWEHFSSQLLVFGGVQALAYTFVLADADKWHDYSAAGAANFTIPPNSSVAFQVGTRLKVQQMAAGQVTLVAGAGVTLLNPFPTAKSRAQYSVLEVVKKATDTWALIGYDVAAS
jgi:hypothetical protein